MVPSDVMLARYASTRDLRDRIRDARDGCLCERAEGVEFVDGCDDLPIQRSGTPCWKAARKWEPVTAYDGCPTGEHRFYFDPPIDEWCATCRARQAYTEQLRAAVRDHAAAKRAILQRGRALVRQQQAGTPRPEAA
jgi:hypothetical protein